MSRQRLGIGVCVFQMWPSNRRVNQRFRMMICALSAACCTIRIVPLRYCRVPLMISPHSNRIPRSRCALTVWQGAQFVMCNLSSDAIIASATVFCNGCGLWRQDSWPQESRLAHAHAHAQDKVVSQCAGSCTRPLWLCVHAAVSTVLCSTRPRRKLASASAVLWADLTVELAAAASAKRGRKSVISQVHVPPKPLALCRGLFRPSCLPPRPCFSLQLVFVCPSCLLSLPPALLFRRTCLPDNERTG